MSIERLWLDGWLTSSKRTLVSVGLFGVAFAAFAWLVLDGPLSNRDLLLAFVGGLALALVLALGDGVDRAGHLARRVEELEGRLARLERDKP